MAPRSRLTTFAVLATALASGSVSHVAELSHGGSASVSEYVRIPETSPLWHGVHCEYNGLPYHEGDWVCRESEELVGYYTEQRCMEGEWVDSGRTCIVEEFRFLMRRARGQPEELRRLIGEAETEQLERLIRQTGARELPRLIREAGEQPEELRRLIGEAETEQLERLIRQARGEELPRLIREAREQPEELRRLIQEATPEQLRRLIQQAREEELPRLIREAGEQPEELRRLFREASPQQLQRLIQQAGPEPSQPLIPQGRLGSGKLIVSPDEYTELERGILADLERRGMDPNLWFHLQLPGEGHEVTIDGTRYEFRRGLWIRHR